MLRRIAAVTAGILLVSVPAYAQRFDASFSGGYTTSEGVNVNESTLSGLVFESIEVKSGGSFNLTFGVYATPNVLIEFLYSRQSSKLQAKGQGFSDFDIADLNVDNYHVNFVYHWGAGDARVRPFALAGLGASYYSPGNSLVAGFEDRQLDGNTQFSWTFGAGVKAYATPNLGFKGMVRWTPTYIKSDPAGYWCDPFYGCWVLGDSDYSQQFEMSGGVTFRF
jgi:opacity protein-like surface antigen